MHLKDPLGTIIVRGDSPVPGLRIRITGPNRRQCANAEQEEDATVAAAKRIQPKPLLPVVCSPIPHYVF
jgi:hypothetical protein